MTAACPVCGRPVEAKYRPFCSARCADADLERWLTGRYAIPAAEGDEEDLDSGGDLPPDPGR